ncbi:hypothetical protein FOIG_03504 [Fusarium odoratissimum NRRL 54006]|uniref:Uncharacterized protein n=2 Tax=Fusarium oxysporum species complex TaxID=171631 RepID=X0K054_FUSO5|nr:uncharacterized protein FOIG_03504 [Fusarium odoratissimum NRRL 54006]EXM06828.1 hypothetical protein FOIG_03504 [Fusarium odoratissimum NRRL 54006]TXC07721.1 hypothetical protein FocTR4_00002866 [Fusarium oxysporum f. sp. cubense]
MGQARRGIKKAASKAKNMRTHFYGREKTLCKRYVSPFSKQKWLIVDFFSEWGDIPN